MVLFFFYDPLRALTDFVKNSLIINKIRGFSVNLR